MTAQHHDLEALRRSEPAPRERPKRNWFAGVTLCVLVIGGLAAIYAVLRPVLFPPREVTLKAVRTVLSDGNGVATSGASVQAACWIEADPFPVTVRPLVSGIVETLDVVEGSPVTKGKTVIAVLRNLEIENALDVATAELAVRTTGRDHAVATLAVARSLLEQKIKLRTDVAQREGELSTARAASERASAERKVAQAALAKAEVDLEAQRQLVKAGHATPTALKTAEAAVKEAEERVRAVRFEEVRLVADLGRITQLLELAREAVKDPRDLQGDVDVAVKALARAEAALRRAKTDVDVAQRNADHLRVVAPIDGVVLRLESAPGALVGPAGEFKGQGEGAGSTGQLNRMTGTLCSLYDPKKLAARVDVPFDDLPGIEPGTKVRIQAKALPGRSFNGVVDRLVREADITQAKLQIKVRVEDPDALLRPEMLATAKFLLQGGRPTASKGTVSARVLVPTEALRDDAIYLYDPTGGGKARRVAVTVLERGDEWTAVEGELGASSKVILDDVRDGEPVKGKQ